MPRKRLELIGKKFGKLMVLEEAGTNKYGKALWKCKCDCGNETLAMTKTLLHTEMPSCGCNKKRDLTGQKFNHLTAMYPINDGARRVNWHWKCDCGNEVDIRGTYVTNGHYKSCGKCDILRKERIIIPQVDYSGSKINDVEILERVPGTCSKNVTYLCKCGVCGNKFMVTSDAIRQGNVKSCGCTYGSSLEKEVASFILELIPSIKMFRNYRIFNDKRSVDIYLPDYKLAIDVNGSKFHSSLGHPFVNREVTFHFDRFRELKGLGIRLLNIFDIDWGDKVKSLLKDIIISNKILYARKCRCVEIKKDVANDFFDTYHLYGGNNMTKWHYGLYFNSELVACMSFGKRRYSEGIELIRYVVKRGYSIVGGARKIFAHFVNDNNIDEVFTYSDNDYFDGGVYERLGFEFLGYTSPDYYWYHSHKGYLTREQCQPKKLKEKYPELYDPNAKSVENDIMLKLKYCRVHRAGNSKWLWKRGGTN